MYQRLNTEDNDVLRKFEAIKPWRKSGKRAPHKPLLILYALGQLQAGKEELFWNDSEESLKDLFFDYGISSIPRPEYPFIRLANDGIWEYGEVPLNKSGDASLTDLRLRNTVGKFKSDVLTAFNRNPDLISRVADIMLTTHFPNTLHNNLQNEANLRAKRTTAQWVRDPKFREEVLYAYSGQCAVCGYNIGTRNKTVGVEAAHIKWVEHKGPDVISNGMALCSNHHELFDFGLWTLSDNLELMVSPRATGNDSLQGYLLRYQNNRIRTPKGKYYPSAAFIDWQRKEVFKG